MKNRTALRQARNSVRVFGIVVGAFAVLTAAYPSPYTVIPLAVTALYLLGDVYTVHVIRRRAAHDQGFLDRDVS
jgi:hypothetical protein